MKNPLQPEQVQETRPSTYLVVLAHRWTLHEAQNEVLSRSEAIRDNHPKAITCLLPMKDRYFRQALVVVRRVTMDPIPQCIRPWITQTQCCGPVDILSCTSLGTRHR